MRCIQLYMSKNIDRAMYDREIANVWRQARDADPQPKLEQEVGEIHALRPILEEKARRHWGSEG